MRRLILWLGSHRDADGSSEEEDGLNSFSFSKKTLILRSVLYLFPFMVFGFGSQRLTHQLAQITEVTSRCEGTAMLGRQDYLLGYRAFRRRSM
jgi:hypothetical protein